MIPYEVDPTLHTAAPAPPQFDDGFSPAPSSNTMRDAPTRSTVADERPDRSGLNSDKSLF